MEFDDIAKLINQAAIERKGRPLKDVERVVLKGAWDNQTYAAMAQTAVGYTEDYLKKDVGPKLWRLLSDLIDQNQARVKVTKRNLHNVLQHWASQFPPTPVHPNGSSPPAMVVPGLPVSPDPLDIPHPPVWDSPRLDGADFYGRRQDLTQLTQWIQTEGCRLVVLWGQQGIGKTALAARLVEHLGQEGRRCGYLNLTATDTVEDLLSALVGWIDRSALAGLTTSVAKINWLLQSFHQYRCLLLLDGGEALFEPCHPAGTYRPETAILQDFFQQVADLPHQSCLLWISREKPADLAQIGGPRVKAHHLTDFPAADVQGFWQQQAKTDLTSAEAQAILATYGGNPLVLKSLVMTVQDVYRQQVYPLLQQPRLTLPPIIHQGIEQTLVHLDPDEALLAYWLAVVQMPVTLASLNEAILPPPRATVVQSLLGRAWCRTIPNPAEDSTTLEMHPMVREVVLEQLQTLLLAELLEGRLALLHQLPLMVMTAPEPVQRRQIATLVEPLVTALRQKYPSAEDLACFFQQSHQGLRHQTLHQPGYGAGNLMHLCHHLNISLAGVDFSELAIWHGDLRQISLQGADFSQAQFRDTLFANALGRSPVVAVSQDNRHLASGDQEGRLLLWDLHRGKLLRVLDDGGAKAIHALAFSPDQAGLAVATETGQIWLWPLDGVYQADSLVGHQVAVRSLAFSPNGRHLASGDDRGMICLWDLPSGSCQSTFVAHQGPIHSLCFNAVGDRLVSGGDDQRACLFDVPQVNLLHQFQGRASAWIRVVGFMVDPLVAEAPAKPFAAGYEDQCLTIWDIEEGRPRWMLPADVHALPAMAISPDGHYLACSLPDYTVALWDIPQRRWCYTLQGIVSPVWTLTFTPDSRYLVTGCDYTIKQWELTAGNCIRSWLSQAHMVHCLAFSHDSCQMLTGHDDSQVRLWSLNPSHTFTSRVQMLTGHSRAVRAVAASADGQWLASSGDEGSIRIWQRATGSCEQVLAINAAAPHLITFSPSSQWLASASQDGIVGIWDVQQGRCAARLTLHNSPPSTLLFGQDQTLISGSREGLISLWSWSEGEQLTTSIAGHHRQVHSLALSLNADWLASASHDGTVRWWSYPEGESLGLWQHPDHHWVHGITITAAGELLAVTSQSPLLEIWSVTDGRRLYQLEGHTHNIWQVSFSPDQSYLATASQDDEIHIWRLSLGSCQQVLRPARPYEGVNIREATGLSEPELAMLKSLGAIVQY